MEKNSIVTHAAYSRSYEGKYGKMYVHKIEFENGDVGEYSSKKEEQNFFKVGQEAKYTIEPSSNIEFLDKIKPVYEDKKGFGKKAPANNKSFALAYAKDIAVALLGQGKEPESYNGTKGIVAMAKVFESYLEGNELT